jgi:hypothetical protein
MACFGMLRRVALVRTDVSEALSSSETSVFTTATRHNIPEGTILQITHFFFIFISFNFKPGK